VPYKTTPIDELGMNDNPMVNAVCGWVPPCRTPGEVVTAVDAAMKNPRNVDLDCVAPSVQLLSELGRTIWKIRRRRTWTQSDVERAVAELKALPSAARNLIESVPSLQPIALQVVVTIIEFSRLRTTDPGQQSIVQQLVSEAKRWSKKPGIRPAIIKNSVTA
jgi:hypothetical protein